MPTSLPSCMRSTPDVVTCTPFRNTLSYGPEAAMMLSPSTVTRSGVGGLPGSVIVHPDGSDVAFTSAVTRTLSLFSARTCCVHFPVRSASDRVAGAAAAAGAAVAESGGAFSEPAHATSTAAHARRGMKRMVLPRDWSRRCLQRGWNVARHGRSGNVAELDIQRTGSRAR